MNMGKAMKITQAMAKMEDAIGALSKVCQDDLASAEVTLVVNQIIKCKEELQKLFERLLSQEAQEDENGEMRKLIEENRLF